MNRREALTRAGRILAEHDIEDANLEGEILVRHILAIDRSELFSDLDRRLKAAKKALAELAKHTMFVKILGSYPNVKG